MQQIKLAPGVGIPLRFMNRHGLVAGATGSGKTRTVQTIVEQCSSAGVPVLVTDVKGDLTGLSQGFPVRFWDLFGDDGLPMKTSIHEMGQMTLARLLSLNATQEGVLNIAFRWCEDRESPLFGTKIFDLDDLRATLSQILDYAEDIREKHGNVTAASVGAIQRAILTIEGQGADSLFGEPALRIDDLLRVDEIGRGMVNLISSDRLLESRGLYSGFMIWLLTTLFTRLPEVGDAEKPKLVVVIDEAHMIFTDAPKILVETIERIVRLIRSRGVGVYFASQNALDIPERVAAQLGNRVQHTMRAFTPKEHNAVKAVAKTFQADKRQCLGDLAAGERPVEARHLERIADILGNAHMRPQRIVLEDNADAPPFRRHAAIRSGHHGAANADLATGELLEAGDKPQKRGLAAA